MSIFGVVLWAISGLLVLLILVAIMYKVLGQAGMTSPRGHVAKRKSKLPLGYRIYSSLPFFDKVIAQFLRMYMGSGYTKLDAAKLSKNNMHKMSLLSLILPLLYMLFVDIWVIKVIGIASYFLIFAMMKQKFISEIYLNDVTGLQDYINEMMDEFVVNEDITSTLHKISLSNSLHALSAERLFDVLNAEDRDKAISEYFRDAPNKYLKQIASMCVDVVIYGDTKDSNGDSRFIDGLSTLLEEVTTDYFHIMNQVDLNKGSSVALLTGFVVPYPLVLFANSIRMSDDMIPFIGSIWFYLVVIISWGYLIWSCIDYLDITHVRTEYDVDFASKAMFSTLLKHAFVLEMVGRIAPTHGRTKRSIKILTETTKKLKDASSRLTVSEFYLQKIVFVTVAFLVMLIVLPLVNHSYINSQIRMDYLSVDASTEDGVIRRNVIRFESELVNALRTEGLPIKERNPENPREAEIVGYKKKFSKVELRDYIFEEIQFIGMFSKDDPEVYASSLANRYYVFNQSAISWYTVLLAFIVSSLVWALPDALLTNKSKSRKAAIQNEIEGFYSVLQIVTTVPNITVPDIIRYLERYSVIFNDELVGARTKYQNDPKGALITLGREINHPLMDGIVSKLLKSYENTSIIVAFSDIKSRRSFIMRDRAYEQSKNLEEKKVAIQKVNGKAITGVFLLYLLAPIVISSIPLMLNSFDGFSEIEGLEEAN